MHLILDRSLGMAYSSKAQQSRVITEHWGLTNLYCPSCTSNSLQKSPNNTPVYDYWCNDCTGIFQLKASSRPIGHKIADAAYDSMVAAILENRCPHLFVLHYGVVSNAVENLFLIPGFSFPVSAIEKRQPLRPTARRAGWVGCNIVLSNIPKELVIPIVQQSMIVPAPIVRLDFARISKLQSVVAKQRTWLIDVLNCVRKIKKADFTLQDVYRFEPLLSTMHPQNKNVLAKIRQQLQMLRDLGFVEFMGRGRYTHRNENSNATEKYS